MSEGSLSIEKNQKKDTTRDVPTLIITIIIITICCERMEARVYSVNVATRRVLGVDYYLSTAELLRNYFTFDYENLILV